MTSHSALSIATSRRRFVLGTGLATASTLLPPFRLLAADDHARLAEDAFIWGAPLVLTGRYRDIAVKAGTPFNQFILSPSLATPKTRAAGPNVDTLYGFAWFDLSATPQVLTVPDTQDRYYSIQLLDAYANSFAYVGRRATGTKAGAFAITPPGFAGQIPAGVTQIKAPTPLVLALVRTLVRGEADLAAARAVHTSYALGPLNAFPNGQRNGQVHEESLNGFPVFDLSKAGAAYFGELDSLVASYPPSDPVDAAALTRFRPIGITPGTASAPNPALTDLLAAAIPSALARVKAADYSTLVNGWRTNFNVTEVIHDPVLRASLNLYGPGTHIAKEALYFSIGGGPDGKNLSGTNRYRLRFPAGGTPPVDGFWSLTLYDENYFLVDNPINRYAINDRTEGLRTGPDGSLEILIQRDRPTDPNANWLPAPAGSFKLCMRTYQPRQEIRDRSYKLPVLQLV
jgi:hypothetical protein